MRLIATVSLLALFSASAAWAANNPASQEAQARDGQTGSGNPAGMAPRTPDAGPNTADRNFIRSAAIGGRSEVELAQLAQQKGSSDAVKSFARLMAEDHGKANRQLSDIANTASVPLPRELDQEHRTARADLEKLSGTQFDLAYMRAQTVDHQATAQLLSYIIGSGQDPQLKQYAANTLPIVLQHLQMAQNITAQLTGQAPPSAPEPGSRGAADPQQGQRPR